ncbi:alpha-galactosidase [Paenibacillus sp. FSL H7-0714]|uniref:alpha-galactosidase n=1 Tax=Paenibacillus sp. FSL H7-0714 TaxID=2954735 RepID=UPI0030FA616F
MRESYAITVSLGSGKKIKFDNLSFGKPYDFDNEYLNMNIGTNDENDIVVSTKDTLDWIKKIRYRFTLEMRNYSKVIAPDSGRWFLRYMSLIDFWRNSREFTSNIGDIKIPLFMFLNNDGSVGNAVGVIGHNIETQFKIIEPESNRALNVHTGNIILDIVRGNETYPIKSSVYSEKVFHYTSYAGESKPWLLVQRDFADQQRQKYTIKVQYLEKALEPMWCSWVDWDSKDINTEMLLSNIKSGVELGINNFIIDDGWYGNGLDSDYSIDMDIGDWEPDSQKIPDMNLLVARAHDIGARLIIWCAPHAVALKSKAYQENKNYLIADANGVPYLNDPQYYSYCFQSPEGREIMAEICLKLMDKWGFDGAKYDLFNWVPDIECQNPNHNHDTYSMIQGLEKTFARIEEKTKAKNPDYIVELKQNYGTLFNMRYGNLMRAGDAPFDLETNYQRTLHIQSYTPFALNDYQSFTVNDTKEDVACTIIKMFAAGVPAYGVNFSKLSEEMKKVIKYYNSFYKENLETFKNFRIPLNPANSSMLVEGAEKNFVFLHPSNNIVDIVGKDVVVFNGSYRDTIIINNTVPNYNVIVKDCFGDKVYRNTVINQLEKFNVPIGGSITIEH